MANEKKIESCKHFINGEFVQSLNGATFPTYNPATGEKICDVALGGAEEINQAVASAKQAFENGPWPAMPIEKRAAIMRKISEAILAKKTDLAWIESLDTGKPLSETLNGDIPRVALNFKFYADLALKQPDFSYRDDDGTLHKSKREPLGVCGLITPWNLPLYLATWKIAPALAQGNTIVLKPAELTPLSAQAFAEILNECGLPPGVVNIVQGFGQNSAGEALVAHPDVSAISFTGETTTGKAIMAKASQTLKKVSFELGGKGASVIFADADLDQACPTVVRAAFRNQGQVCLAGSRLIVAEVVAHEVVQRVLREIEKIVVGNPMDPKTTMGSLISQEHRDKVQSYVEIARHSSEMQILCGGKIPEKQPSEGAYFEPTLIFGVPQDSRLIQEEIFGPVLTVQTFRDRDEALAMLNGTKYGLSCSIWSQSQPTLDYTSSKARMGIVWLNSWFLRNLNTPFGGMKMSGVGREGGQYSLDFFCDWKAISYGS